MSDKVAVVVYMQHESPVDRGRMAHALHLAKEIKAAGKELAFIFAGKSVDWLPQLCNPNRDEEHPFVRNYGNLFDAVREDVVACNFCTRRFEARDEIEAAGVKILGEGRDHMELSRYALDGYQIIQF